MHRRTSRQAQLLTFALGAVIFLALIAGLLDHPPEPPVDSDTPSTVHHERPTAMSRPHAAGQMTIDLAATLVVYVHGFLSLAVVRIRRIGIGDDHVVPDGRNGMGMPGDIQASSAVERAFRA